MRHFSIALLASLVAVPQAAAQLPDDVQRVERAVTELGAAKRELAPRVAANRRASERALAACKSRGPGWARIRAVRVPAQRRLFARGARKLWRSLGEVAAERAALDAYRPAFRRFLARLDPPLDDPALREGVAAWRRRLALYEASTSIGTCASFNRLAKRARQFPETVESDYLAGDVYNGMVRFVDESKRRAARHHWGSRYHAALRAARDRLVELGGNSGLATFFAFGHSLRG